MHLCLLILALVSQPLATVSGRILDQEGQPLVRAVVTYKYLGIVDKDIQKIPGMRSETSRMIERGGRTFTTRTDRKGAFAIAGVEYGVYEIEITAAGGHPVYSGRKAVGDPADINSQNVLNVDLSLAVPGLLDPGTGTNLAGGKKTKEQLDLIRQENSNAAKINRLIVRYHTALSADDWEQATALLQQLIALDPHRWEFYQNLGLIQSNHAHYQQAAQSFARGAEAARAVLANPSDTDRALTTVGDLLLGEADCYEHMGRPDEAVDLYRQAAAAYPHPFIARFRACNALINNGRPDEAIAECNRAIADDPAQWGPYQVLGGVLAAEKPEDALAVYQQGVAAARKKLEQSPGSPRDRIALGQMLNAEGNLLVKLKKYDAAIETFTGAAESAAYPAMPYFNLCATYYNLKRTQEALAACNRAVASDPALADAYYIIGAILFGQGRVEQGRFQAPPGTAEALKKYLENSPYGEHVSTVRDMLDQLGKATGPFSPPQK